MFWTVSSLSGDTTGASTNVQPTSFSNKSVPGVAFDAFLSALQGASHTNGEFTVVA